MHPTSILSRYLARQFLTTFLLMLGILLAIVLLIDTIELIRRGADRPGVTIGMLIAMGLMKLPQIGQQIVPFGVMFSAMFVFWRLTRSHELVIARAVGVSVWQFLTPVLIVAFLIGVVRVTVADPIGARLIGEYKRLEAIYIRKQTDTFEISQSGLWLRQQDGDTVYFMRAASIDPGTVDLRDVVIFRFAAADQYDQRIEGPLAILRGHEWVLPKAVMRHSNRPLQVVTDFRIPTALSRERIEESFAPPDTISFWGLRSFIATLEATGFSAIRHRLHFQSLLSQPLLFCAMVLLAAAFSMRQVRRGGTLVMVTGGVCAGFAFFIMTDVVLSLGISETIPVVMAAWTPAAVSLIVGATALLYLEDG